MAKKPSAKETAEDQTAPAPADNTPAPPDNAPAPADNTPAPPDNAPAPVDNTPAPPDNAPAPVDPPAPATATLGELTGHAAPATSDAELFPGLIGSPTEIPPANPSAPASIPTNNKEGCQCEACKTSGGNKDKRGRHHAACLCPICAARKGEPAKPAPVADANPFAVVTDAATDDSTKYAVLGEMSFDIGAGTLCTLFGPEWQPRTKEERATVSVAIANYYKAKGVQDLPPGALLAVVLLAYAGPRLAHDNTQSKLKLAWAWTKVKLGGLFRRRKI